MTALLSSAVLPIQSDRCLLALARDGHEAAFETIVRRYRRPLLRYCARIVPSAGAEDVIQQTFLRAWGAIGDGAEIRDLRPWLYAVARNAALDWLRQAHDEAQLPENLAATLSTADRVQQQAAARDALSSLAALPERQRLALLGVAVEGRRGAEVAATLGLSENAFRQLLQRARTTVRAAASALTPVQLLIWLLGHRSAPGSARIIRAAARVGTPRFGGLPAMLAKSPAALVAAGALAAAPVLVVTQLHGAPHRGLHTQPHARTAPPRTLASLQVRALAPPDAGRREARHISSPARPIRHAAAKPRVLLVIPPAPAPPPAPEPTPAAAPPPAPEPTPAAAPSVPNTPAPQLASGGEQPAGTGETSSAHIRQITALAAPPQAEQPSPPPTSTDASNAGASTSSGEGISTSSTDPAAAPAPAPAPASSSAPAGGSTDTSTSSTDN